MRGSRAIIATVVIKSDVIAISVRGARSRRFEFPWRIKIEPQPTRQGSNLSVLRRPLSARDFGGRVTAASFFIAGHVARLAVLAIAHSASRRNMLMCAVGPSRVVAI
jgi:hypothetical protein